MYNNYYVVTAGYFSKAKKLTFPGAAALDTGTKGMQIQVILNKASTQ